MGTKVVRYIDFDAAHRVLGHEGKCAHLHGHRYRVGFTITGDTNSIGMVIDFGYIKEAWGDLLMRTADHGVILSADDVTLGAAIFSADPACKIWEIPYPATAEGIAHALWDILHVDSILKGAKLTAVEVWETPNCMGGYYA